MAYEKHRSTERVKERVTQITRGLKQVKKYEQV